MVTTKAHEFDMYVGTVHGIMIDWTDWITARGYTAGQISSVTFAITKAKTMTIAGQTLVGSQGFCWFQSISAGERAHVTCTLLGPVPVTGSPPVQEIFGFDMKGLNP